MGSTEVRVHCSNSYLLFRLGLKVPTWLFWDKKYREQFPLACSAGIELLRLKKKNQNEFLCYLLTKKHHSKKRNTLCCY